MSVEIINGDCRAVLAGMPAGAFDAVVTSPPYFGLRDYGHSGQIGQEPSPGEFVAELVAVFREVRRVLRDDGTLWINLGDSYASSMKGTGGVGRSTLGAASGGNSISAEGILRSQARQRAAVRRLDCGLRDKQLIGIPWRVAFALQDDGWYLRQDIIWSKPNPMPESVRDRCTKAHEYIFLLSKSPRYYFDAEAIAEPLAISSVERLNQNVEDQVGLDRVPGKTNGRMKAAPPRFGGAKYGDSDDPHHATKSGVEWSNQSGLRNRRSVWVIPTQSFSGSHFATFPPELIRPCIRAGAPIGGRVLDPFGGAGTTALVASQEQRSATLIEINPTYAALALERVRAEAGLLEDVTLTPAPPSVSGAAASVVREAP